MTIAPLVVALVLGQSSAPFVRSRVEPGKPDTQCLFWTVPTLTWHLSRTGNPLSGDAQRQAEFEAIRRSYKSWQDVFAACGNLTLTEGPLVDDRRVGYEQKATNRNIVLFRGQSCSKVAPADDKCWQESTCDNTYDCWDENAQTIAITLTTYDVKSGIIYDSDIQLNAAHFTFTTAEGPVCVAPNTSNCVSTDVQNTMTHEVGHLLGLDHTNAPNSTMNPRAPTGETSKRTLDAGSRDFICQAYPKGRPSQGCFTLALDSSDAVLGRQPQGCSSTASAPSLLALAASGAWLSRRRRQEGSR